MKRVLVACEESQAVTLEFRKLGIDAYSCDLVSCSGGHPEWHLQTDVTKIINGEWDLMIAHPPCTYLTVTGNRWFHHPDDKHLPVEERRPHPRFPDRKKHREEAIKFFMVLANAPIPRIVIENPVGIINTLWRKPDQIVQPYMFGDEATKTTCLWLKNLPVLVPDNIVTPGERVYYSSGKSHPKWYADALSNAASPEERMKIRSKTFPGMARAMAEQWGSVL
jgi:hypothetical protein